MLCENKLLAFLVVAEEAASSEDELAAFAHAGKVRGDASVETVNAPRELLTAWTAALRRDRDTVELESTALK